MANNNASLFLNIIPVESLKPKYNQDQLYYAVEKEFYLMQDQINLAIEELPYDIENETSIVNGSSSSDAYDSFPVNLAGLNTLATSADASTFAAQVASYNSSPSAISYGMPDGFGMRYGLYQWPWVDNVIAAGTGKSIPILEGFLGGINVPKIALKTPAFDAWFKGVTDVFGFRQDQINYFINQSRSILRVVSSTVDSFKDFSFDNLPTSVGSTIFNIVNRMNMNPFKTSGFFSNAFSGVTFTDVNSTSNSNLVNKLYTEQLWGFDKYVTPNAATNIIPMDYNALRINMAKGNLRQMALGDASVNGESSIQGIGAGDLQTLAFKNYGVDQHLQNRIEGINNGEQPLPATRDVIEREDEPKIYNVGFEPEEYQPRDIETGMGGKPGKTDYSPLAVGETSGNTPIEKRSARAVTGIATADGGSITEPTPNYATKYPENIVFEKNGIVIEVDSTPGNERIHVYHPSHSYIEIDQNGNLTIRNAKNRTEIVDFDYSMYVRANKNVAVDGNDGEKIKGVKKVNASMIYLNSD